MVFLSDKQYLYLAFFVIGIIFFYIMHNILLLRSDSCIAEPFETIKSTTWSRKPVENVLGGLIEHSESMIGLLHLDNHAKSAKEGEPEGGIYQQILEELEDSLEIAQLGMLLNTAVKMTDDKNKSKDKSTFIQTAGSTAVMMKHLKESIKDSLEFVKSDRWTN